MARNLAQHLTRESVPQTEALPGQVANSAGGFSFGVSDWTRFERFLVLGSEGGSYYATERKLTKENATSVLTCANADPARAAKLIRDISHAGRAPKNDAAIFALSLMISLGSLEAKRAAIDVINDVCRIATHLFQFIKSTRTLRGNGAMFKAAVRKWYEAQCPSSLANQLTKYQAREEMSHLQAVDSFHPRPKRATEGSDLVSDLFFYATYRKPTLPLPETLTPAQTSRIEERELRYKKVIAQVPLLAAIEEAHSAPPRRICELIQAGQLSREHLPTESLTHPEVWEALLEHMGATAMMRNLNTMTRSGLVAPLSAATNLVCSRLRDKEFLRKGRLHPFNLLNALLTYGSGKGFRGTTTWVPVPEVSAALEDAFYLSFETIVPTAKRHLFGIDVSGSMSTPMQNSMISCAVGSACLAMVGIRTEPRSYAFGFAQGFKDLGITARDSLAEASMKTQERNFGSTDCAVPPTYALDKKLEVDAFIVLTDSETYAGRTHPTVALEKYRQKMGIGAKLIVVGMVSNGFTIADPTDAGQLDVVGFDASAPAVIADFVRN